jgi:exopolysaccharide biosynthesis protein
MPYIDNSSLGGNVKITELLTIEALDDGEGNHFDNLKQRLDTKDALNNEKFTEVDAEAAETAYYDEITFEKLRDDTSKTDYFLTTIPNLDSEGNLIKLEHGYQNEVFNSGTGESVRSFASRNITSFAINASTFDTITLQPRGIQIQDEMVMQGNVNNSTNRHVLGIKADNTLVSYPPTTPTATILADGCLNALTGFYPMIQNGLSVDPTVYTGESNTTLPNPRQVIAQMANNDIIVLTCEGRSKKNTGMTYDDLIRILLAKGVTFAYCLDGGGSGQTMLRGVILNNPIDDGGKTERKVPDFLYVKKTSTNPQVMKTTNKDIGILNKQVKDIVADILNMGSLGATSEWITDCNVLIPSGLYWAGSSALNRPTSDIPWGILHNKASDTSALQIAFPYHDSKYNIKLRRTNADGSGSWNAWRDMKASVIGTLTYNGDGVATSKTIAHGLGVIPAYYQVTPASLNTGTAGIKYVTADATNLTVFFNVAPVTGTNNIVLNWKAEV